MAHKGNPFYPDSNDVSSMIAAGAISAVNLSAGASSNNLSAFVFSNSNNVSFGLSGSTVTASISAAAGGVNVAAGSQTAGTGTVLFADSNGISFGMSGSTRITASFPAQLSVGVSTGGNTAGDTGVFTGRVVFAGGNNVTLSGSSNGASATFSIHGPNTAAQSNQTVGLYATGNTTQNSSTTLDARTVSFNALGAMTMGFSNGSVQVSAPAVSSLSGVGGISISTNGSTISISGWNLGNYEPYPPNTSTTNYPAGIGSWYVEPFILPGNVSGGRLNRVMSFGSTASILRASSSNFQTDTTGTRAASFQYFNSVALYTLGAGTNSTRLESAWSNTFSFGIESSCSVSSAAAVLRITCGATISLVTSIDSAGAYTTSTIGSTTSFSTTATSIGSTNATAYVSSVVNMLSGSVVLPIGMNSTLTPGNYWLGQAWSTASTSSGTSGNVFSFNSQFALSIPAYEYTNSIRLWLQTVSTNGSQWLPGRGVYSAVSASPPVSMAFSDVRSYGSALRQYFNFVNSTI